MLPVNRLFMLRIQKTLKYIILCIMAFSGGALADTPSCPNGRYIYSMIDEQQKITESIQIVAFLAGNASVKERSYFPDFTREAFIFEQLESDAPEDLPYALIYDRSYIFKFTGPKDNFFFLVPVSPYGGKFAFSRPLYFDRKGTSRPWFAETAIVGVTENNGFPSAINFQSGSPEVKKFPETIILTSDYKFIPYRYMKKFIEDVEGAERFYRAFNKTSGVWIFSKCGS